MAHFLLAGEQQQQQTSTTMTTMPPLQLQNGQLPADWNQRGIQVVQQPIQQANPAYLQTIYGQQVLMPSNLLQQGSIQGFNQQPQIQVIAAPGKPLQSGQITPQMLATAQGKQVIGNSATGFQGAYTLPTSQSQTLVFSPIMGSNVFSSQPQQQQQNILPMSTTTTQNNAQGMTQQAQQIAANNKDMKNFSTQQKVVQQKANTVNGAGQTISTQNANAQISQSAIPTAQIINQIQQPQGGQQMQFAAPVRSFTSYSNEKLIILN